MIAQRALGVSPGDEGVVPAMTYVATATAVSLIGGVPVFADIGPDTHPLSSSSSKPPSAKGSRPLWSLGASWNGIRTEALGIIAVFSFAATKNIAAA